MKQAFYLLVIITITSTTTVFSQKSGYSSTEAKFSITMPAPYTEEVENKDIGVQSKVTSKVDEITFMAIFTKHNALMEDNEKTLLKVSLDSFQESLNGTLTSKGDWKVKKNIGILTEIELPDNEATVQYGVIIANNIQYQLAVVALTKDFDYKASEKFFKSFKFKK